MGGTCVCFERLNAGALSLRTACSVLLTRITRVCFLTCPVRRSGFIHTNRTSWPADRWIMKLGSGTPKRTSAPEHGTLDAPSLLLPFMQAATSLL